MAAFVGGDSCVDALMSGEMSGLGERPVASALVTDVGSVSCVGAFVSGEVAR
ncbi:hypothetical protein [Sansalvadorimonas verongulae]|uniref:hypothetical protein n=1 Tax=Sansalvadorimonas verongulae TaxID=2172824 RepID=UPI001E4C5FD4|nr:hypothetical protein [Sansalvadorimonas verongulae]